MFAEQVVEAHKEPEEPSMLRRALRAILPDIPKEDALKKQQNNPNLVDIGAEPYDLNSPLPDGIDRRNMDELINLQRSETGGAAPTKRDMDELIKMHRSEMGYKEPQGRKIPRTDAGYQTEFKTPVVGGMPKKHEGKRDYKAEAAKQYAFLNNRDFDVIEAPDDKSEYAADLLMPTPENKLGRQQFKIYAPDRVREVDVAHTLLQRDPEMDKVMQRLSPKLIKTFGGDANMRYFLARHAVGGYSPEEEAELALDTAGAPLKELAYLRNYARTGKALSPVDEVKAARGQTV